jgi:hypothetical protein
MLVNTAQQVHSQHALVTFYLPNQALWHSTLRKAFGKAFLLQLRGCCAALYGLLGNSTVRWCILGAVLRAVHHLDCTQQRSTTPCLHCAFNTPGHNKQCKIMVTQQRSTTPCLHCAFNTPGHNTQCKIMVAVCVWQYSLVASSSAYEMYMIRTTCCRLCNY